MSLNNLYFPSPTLAAAWMTTLWVIDTLATQRCMTLATVFATISVVFSERARSLYAIARPSVCRLSSVTLVRPTQAVEIFGNIFTALGTLAIR